MVLIMVQAVLVVVQCIHSGILILQQLSWLRSAEIRNERLSEYLWANRLQCVRSERAKETFTDWVEE